MSEAGAEGMVRFRVGRCDLSIEVGAVEEVIRLGGVADMKRHIPGVQGAIPYRGRVVPVIALGRILDIPGGEPTRAIVARGRGVRVALGVEDVVGLYERPQAPAEVPGAFGIRSGVIREFHNIGDGIVGWLDLERVFSEHDWEGFRSLAEIGTDGLLGDSTLEILGY